MEGTSAARVLMVSLARALLFEELPYLRGLEPWQPVSLTVMYGAEPEYRVIQPPAGTTIRDTEWREALRRVGAGEVEDPENLTHVENAAARALLWRMAGLLEHGEDS